MRKKHPFAPQYGETKSLAVTTSSSNVEFKKGSHSLRIFTPHTSPIFFKVGTGASLAATTDDMPLPITYTAGRYVTISIPHDADRFAAIALSGSVTIYITPGSGA